MAQIGFSYTGFINIAAGATVEFWITGPFGADTYNHVLPTSAFSGIEGSEGRLQAYDLLVLATRMTRGGQFEAPYTVWQTIQAGSEDPSRIMSFRFAALTVSP